MILPEFSCGGVVLDGNKVLLIKVKTMKGRKIWTFPKGHIEEGETPRQAALREVLEETGYRAKIVRPLLKVRDSFTLKGNFIKKAVQWYLMTKLVRIGKPDTSEILAVDWVSLNKAKEKIDYPSDARLLEIVSGAQQYNPAVEDL